jgi:rhamnose utilization protein RhaD (predicted bifunctional aldolase and dehydrogenase)
MPSRSSAVAALLGLSHELGREGRMLAILGEGNASARVSPGTFLVKASGSNLATLAREGLTECRMEGLLALLGKRNLGDSDVTAALLASRVDPRARIPSVEAVFHAWLLTLPGVQFVGHTHPVAVNGLLCSRWARSFSERRLFPDEIVCCGEASVFVPYTDPGHRLAQAIRRETTRFIERRGQAPRVILLANHGLIAIGSTPQAVLAGTLMAEKAAHIFTGAASTGASPRFLSGRQVTRISGRPDEHYRRKALGL